MTTLILLAWFGGSLFVDGAVLVAVAGGTPELADDHHRASSWSS